eukprot:2305590-Ditylum_brightwellii.AAC.1
MLSTNIQSVVSRVKQHMHMFYCSHIEALGTKVPYYKVVQWLNAPLSHALLMPDDPLELILWDAVAEHAAIGWDNLCKGHNISLTWEEAQAMFYWCSHSSKENQIASSWSEG